MRYLLLLLLISSGRLLAQTSYDYNFTIQGATNYGAGKNIVTEFRAQYNSHEEPRRFFPVFNDESDSFSANSEILVTKEEMESFLASRGYTLLSYERKLTAKELIKADEE